MAEMSISRAITWLARQDPDRVAVDDLGPGGRRLTRAELDRESNRWARALRDRTPVARDDLVVVELPNGAAMVLACLAVWKLGATPVPCSPSRPEEERAAVREAAGAALVVDSGTPAPAPGTDDGPLPDVWASAWKAPASGGSTGRPKIVVSTGAARVDPEADVAPYLPRGQVQLVSGPLTHSAPFTYAMRGLMTGHRLVILPRFDPEAVLDAVARFRVTWALLVPTTMHRIARLPTERTSAADLSSLRTLVHLGAPCPEPVKRWWIDRIGAERVVEVYASSESSGITMIRGDEWLRHPGSVGRPVGGSSFRVVSPGGDERDAGTVGEVVMRREGPPRYRYLGAQARRIPGWPEWDAPGDLGWLDDDGYLYLVDRTVDTITVGGATVHPARVEAALEAHPDVRSSAVIGLPGPDGDRVHALLDLDGATHGGGPDGGPGGPTTAFDVLAWVRDRLPPEQVPATVEAVTGPLRDDAGKVNRSALRSGRSS